VTAPLVPDEKSPEVYGRNLALSEISFETRWGEVEGVRFDLRHPQIDPSEWVMDHIGGCHCLDAPRRTETLPFLWFPWYGKFDLAKTKAEVLEEFLAAKEYAENGPPAPRESYGNISDAEYAEIVTNERKQRRIPKTWMKDELKARTPDAIVNPEDCVRTYKAVKYLGHNKFVHAHDNSVIHLFIQIIDPQGNSRNVDVPIIMHGVTKLTYRRGNKKIYSILNRVRKYHALAKLDVKSIRDSSDNYTKSGSANNALYRAGEISDLLPSVWKLVHSAINRRSMMGLRFLNALDDACMLGYAWAYAEAEQNMRPLAEAAAASRAGAARAGQASGARRRAKAASTWQALVKREAATIRAEDSAVSQASLADEIKFKFDDEVPSHPIIVRHIARLERAGELQRRRTRT
jgi:hypothetical protein